MFMLLHRLVQSVPQRFLYPASGNAPELGTLTYQCQRAIGCDHIAIHRQGVLVAEDPFNSTSII